MSRNSGNNQSSRRAPVPQIAGEQVIGKATDPTGAEADVVDPSKPEQRAAYEQAAGGQAEVVAYPQFAEQVLRDVANGLGMPLPETILGATILGALGELPPRGYISNQVSVRLSPAAGEALTRLRVGLNAGAVRMASGRFVQDNTHAVIWLLEQIALASTTSVTVPAREPAE